MPATCFECGEPGHISADCPNLNELDGRPPWCEICDRQTRQIWLNQDGTRVQRCPRCHPLRYKMLAKMLAQYRRCAECKTIVYTWDNNPCGDHQSPGAPDRRLTIERIREIERSNS